MEVINAIGRRKSAVARVFVSEGTGKITINKRDLAVYFPSSLLQYVVLQPLKKLEVAEKYDIKVNLDGGGYNGQANALRLAIARALVKINPDDKKALRSEGFLTRDSRSVERKKPGQPKARRRYQCSRSRLQELATTRMTMYDRRNNQDLPKVLREIATTGKPAVFQWNQWRIKYLTKDELGSFKLHWVVADGITSKVQEFFTRDYMTENGKILWRKMATAMLKV